MCIRDSCTRPRRARLLYDLAWRLWIARIGEAFEETSATLLHPITALATHHGAIHLIVTYDCGVVRVVREGLIHISSTEGGEVGLPRIMPWTSGHPASTLVGGRHDQGPWRIYHIAMGCHASGSALELRDLLLPAFSSHRLR